MSGLLRRLARQALGAGGPAIHSQARIPYAATRAWAEDSADAPKVAPRSAGFGETFATDAPTESRAMPKDEEPGGELPRANPDHSEPAGETRPDFADRRGAPEHFSAPVLHLALPADENAERGNPLAPEKSENVTASGQLPRTVESMHLLDDREGQTSASAPIAGPVSESSLGGGKALDSAPGGTGVEACAESREPGPALPPALLGPLRTEPPAALLRAAAGRESPFQSTGGAAHEATEVHVHIGRIEVSAVQESKTQRRSPASARRQPMSLDEYLAKRRGGES